MATTTAAPLRHACEALRMALAESVGLTSLRVDLYEGPDVRTVRLDEGPPPAARVPASISVPLRDGQGLFGAVTVEDTTRSFYPAQALVDVERIGAQHAASLRIAMRSRA